MNAGVLLRWCGPCSHNGELALDQGLNQPTGLLTLYSGLHITARVMLKSIKADGAILE